MSQEQIELNKETDRKDAPAITEADVKNHQKSAGERIFDRTVYTGIGLFVNEVGSLVVTGQMERGIGKNWYERTAPKIAKMFYKGNVTDAKNGMMWASLTLVGTALVWPMKILEDNKAKIVKKIDHTVDGWRGHKLSAEQVDKRDAEVEATIACEHKQTWPSLIIGRIISIGTSMTLSKITGIKTNSRHAPTEEHPKGQPKSISDHTMEFTDKWITKGAVGVNGLFGGKSDSKLARMINRAPEPGLPTNNFHYYARLMAPETIGCIATSIVLETSSKFIASKMPARKNEDLCATVEKSSKTKDILDKGQKNLHIERVNDSEAVAGQSVTR